MPSQQIELKSDIANLFKDLEEIASSTQVIAPHVPKIKSADITELFSGLDEAYEEAKRLSLEEKEKLEAFSNLVETFGSVIEEEPESLKELFSEIIEPETDEETEDVIEEITIVEKKTDLVDKAIAHLDDMQEKTEVKEEISQIASLRKEFDNFRNLISQKVASSQMSGAGSGEVRLEFLDDVDRDSVKVDGRFLQYNSTSKKVDGGNFQSLSSNIIPSVDNTFDLGSASKQWRNLFLGGSTLVVEGASLAADELTVLDGVTAGTITASKVAIPDSNKDISGNVDIDGTLEADAITVNGTTLAETISDTVGAMVTSNTESGIAVTYDDNDNTLDFVIGTLNQDTTGNAGTATALETARTIAGVSFDGTSNITIASTDLSDASNLISATSTTTLTNKTLTSPVLDTGISGSAFLDEDDMSSDSATKVASQQSIKSYVDASELRTRAFAIAIGAGL